MNLTKFLLENPDYLNGITINMNASDLIEFMNYMIERNEKKEPLQSIPNELDSVEERLITIDEATVIFGVSRVTLWQWGKKGIVTPVKIGHIVRYKISDIRKILTSLQPQFNKKSAR